MKSHSLLPSLRLTRPGFDAFTLICALLLVGQVVMSLAVGGVNSQSMGVYEELGLSCEGILQGKIWQLLTHVFIHGSWIHWLLNWLMIYLVGGRVVHILGGRAFVKIFFGGVLLGSLFHLLLHPRLPLGVEGELANAPLVGASAAAMALLLVMTGLSPDSRMWPLPVSGKNLGRGLLVATLVLFIITPGLGIPGLSRLGAMLRDAGMGGLFQVGHIYHFGGGLMGLLYARYLLRRPVTLDDLQKARARREGMAA